MAEIVTDFVEGDCETKVRLLEKNPTLIDSLPVCSNIVRSFGDFTEAHLDRILALAEKAYFDSTSGHTALGMVLYCQIIRVIDCVVNDSKFVISADLDPILFFIRWVGAKQKAPEAEFVYDINRRAADMVELHQASSEDEEKLGALFSSLGQFIKTQIEAKNVLRHPKIRPSIPKGTDPERPAKKSRFR